MGRKPVFTVVILISLLVIGCSGGGSIPEESIENRQDVGSNSSNEELSVSEFRQKAIQTIKTITSIRYTNVSETTGDQSTPSYQEEVEYAEPGQYRSKIQLADGTKGEAIYMDSRYCSRKIGAENWYCTEGYVISDSKKDTWIDIINGKTIGQNSVSSNRTELTEINGKPCRLFTVTELYEDKEDSQEDNWEYSLCIDTTTFLPISQLTTFVHRIEGVVQQRIEARETYRDFNESITIDFPANNLVWGEPWNAPPWNN